MNNFEMSHTTNHHILPALDVPRTILHEIMLGVHRLCILSGQSIIVSEQDITDDAAQGLHLDAMETYRLMMCLREMFQQKSTHS